MRVIHFTPAIAWFIISLILLTLPGNELPHNTLFDIPNFDKLVHFGMFFMLTVLFCFPFSKMDTKPSWIMAIFYKVVFFVILYGIIIEFVQKYFTIERSFDVVDILFDALGSFAGLWVMRQYAYKKIGPNENRGRNQN